MNKINIIGTSGSGKSTIARALSEKLNCPYVELDDIFWKPNWGESTDEELFRNLKQALDHPRWVLDGNYTRTIPIKWADADTVIWLDFSFARTLYQAVTRAFMRSLTKQEICSGNTETFRKSFFSRDSVILWTLKTYQSNRVRNLKLMENPDYGHINFIRLTSPKQANFFIENNAGTNVKSAMNKG